MGLLEAIGRAFPKQRELEALYDLGMIESGHSPGGYWRDSTVNRMSYVAIGRRVVARQQEQATKERKRYPAPSRNDGYYSQMRADGTVEQFIGRDGNITSERPHVHIVHSEREGKILFVVTQRDGSHTHRETLPITASGNEVNAVIIRLRRKLR